MAEGRARSNWDTTAALLALTFNVHRDPKKSRPAKASDFHPYSRGGRRAGVPITAGNIRLLKKAFIEGGQGRPAHRRDSGKSSYGRENKQ